MEGIVNGFLKMAKAKLTEVASVAVMCDGKMLMGKRRDSGKWTNPGGHMDPGEKPEEGAKRELMEEAGIKATHLRKVKTEDVINEEGKKIRVHGYLMNCITRPNTTMKHDPDNEVHRWQWVDTKPLPEHVSDNLHAPKNILLKALKIKNY